MNKKAIVVYLDNNPKCVEEFSWLYKTWILWEIYSEFDLVVYHNPEVSEKIPQHKNIIKREMLPLNETDDFWRSYPFVNSFAMFINKVEKEWISKTYQYILKTDCDVFLTKHILGKEPDKIMIGRGGYLRSENSDEILDNLKRIQQNLNLKNANLNHVGSSLFGKTSIITILVNSQFLITKYLLASEWKESIGEWPSWCRGVASMYGIHLSVNNHLNNQNVYPYSLDDLCWNNRICSNVIHIHAWHGNDDFSKHKWFRGEYKKPTFSEIPIISKDYCLLVASHSVEELLKLKNPKELSIKKDDVVFYVIYSKEERLEYMKKQISDLNISFDVKYFKAYTPETNQEYIIKNDGLSTEILQCCFKSHISAIKDFSENYPDKKYVCVLEDDVSILKEKFEEKFLNVLDKYDNNEELDYLSIGYLPTTLTSYLDSEKLSLVKNQDDLIYYEFNKGFTIWGAQAQIFSKKTSEKIVEILDKKTGYDVYESVITYLRYNEEKQNKQLYLTPDSLIPLLFSQGIVNPPLVIEGNFNSTIHNNSDSEIRYNNWKTYEKMGFIRISDYY